MKAQADGQVFSSNRICTLVLQSICLCAYLVCVAIHARACILMQALEILQHVCTFQGREHYPVHASLGKTPAAYMDVKQSIEADLGLLYQARDDMYLQTLETCPYYISSWIIHTP